MNIRTLLYTLLLFLPLYTQTMDPEIEKEKPMTIMRFNNTGSMTQNTDTAGYLAVNQLNNPEIFKDIVSAPYINSQIRETYGSTFFPDSSLIALTVVRVFYEISEFENGMDYSNCLATIRALLDTRDNNNKYFPIVDLHTPRSMYKKKVCKTPNILSTTVFGGDTYHDRPGHIRYTKCKTCTKPILISSESPYSFVMSSEKLKKLDSSPEKKAAWTEIKSLFTQAHELQIKNAAHHAPDDWQKYTFQDGIYKKSK